VNGFRCGRLAHNSTLADLFGDGQACMTWKTLGTSVLAFLQKAFKADE
jgi:hypothetical protein